MLHDIAADAGGEKLPLERRARVVASRHTAALSSIARRFSTLSDDGVIRNRRSNAASPAASAVPTSMLRRTASTAPNSRESPRAVGRKLRRNDLPLRRNTGRFPAGPPACVP